MVSDEGDATVSAVVGGSDAARDIPDLAEAPDGPVDGVPDRIWDRRPVASVAVVGFLVALGNIWWVFAHRAEGALSIDEAGYARVALTYHRILDPAHPGAVLAEFLSPSPTGAFVQLLSVPALVLGPRSVESVISAQAVTMVVAAVAAAGCVARISTRRAAFVVGMVVLTMPAMTLSARTYQFAGATGAALLLALWALLSSDRGRRPLLMLGFGVSVGAMLLTRPMSAGFLPGVVLAVLILVDWSWLTARWVAMSAAVSVLVAGPWWYRSRDELSDYLFDYGYGDEASNYGGASLLGRLGERLASGLGDLRVPMVIVGFVTVGFVVASGLRWRRSGVSIRDWPPARRDLAALVAVVVAGYVALMSTANLGVWFELPVELVVVVLVGAAGGLVGGVAMRRLGAAALIVSGVSFAVSLTDPGGEYDVSTPRGLVQGMFYGGLWDRSTDPVVNDERFASNDADVRRAAADEWAAASRGLVEVLGDVTADDTYSLVTMSGSTQLVNTNTLGVAYELESVDAPDFEVPDTRAPEEFLLPYLEPAGGDLVRTLLIVQPTTEQLREDVGADTFRRLAIEEGWSVVDSVDLPDGGVAEILRLDS